ncbi:type I-E CRISPR-associated protein Cas6/Cse3/CasE [Bowmanella pacifica]|uniref:Type I-E CRISPR-associated protein Cas6/Cse3/CasE n=1 Tax=Bowmanella pacifica TaxID=502051 RepID=A0A917YV55_9ALTE|nr:type I-E CRISPR-associated protein Cas6/Cse3/CasE [Bowmanella pacifica]GGO67549.1 type I-E CRISPR-associated protein Cas6/Cse3/CasE [Bowmanella pacifica]
MFLSKVSLNNSALAKKELVKLVDKGAYASHQLLWKLFADPTATERPFIFREEQCHGAPIFYVLSHIPPIHRPEIFTQQVKPFTPKLEPGSRLAFQLRANPTINIKDGSKNGKTHDVLMHAKRQLPENKDKDIQHVKKVQESAAKQWLMDEERLNAIGVAMELEPDVVSYQQHCTYKRDTRAPIRFSTVDYQGVIKVMEPELFIGKLSAGIGRAKAFGCGLMLIRRV